MTVLRSEARAVLQWCLNQPDWWRTCDVSDDLGYSLDAARKQMLRLDALNLIERGALNGRTPLWRIRDREAAERVADEQPGPRKNNYQRKGRKQRVAAPVNSVWSLAQ